MINSFRHYTHEVFVNTAARLTRVLATMVAVLMAATLLVFPPAEASAQVAEPQAAPSQMAAASQLPSSGVCGTSLAIVVDLSNSLSSSDVQNLKTSLRTLVNNLAGAPYNIGLYSFGTNAPAFNLSNLPATSVADQTGRNKLNNAINALYNLPNSNNAEGGTNWEGGLQRVRQDMQAGTKYDTVYFISDGQPTFDNNGSNKAGNTTERTEIDKPVDEKNRIAQLGAKVIPVGVGSTIKDNERLQVAEYKEAHWSGWNYQRAGWYHYEYSYTQTLLARIATEGQSPIIVNKYADLPAQLAENVINGCLHIVNNIVDGDGNVIEPGAHWTYDLGGTTGSVTTNASGIKELAVDELSSNGTATVKIKQQTKDGFSIVPTGDRAAACVAHRANGTIENISVSKETDAGVGVKVDSTSIIVCTFNNRPSVPVSITKNVSVNTDQLRDELNSVRYTFDYVCRDGGKEVAKGEIKDVIAGKAQQIGVFPLGTDCVITERKPSYDEDRINMATTWSTTNADVVKSEGFSVTIKTNADAYLKGSGTAVTVLNTFDAPMGTITLTKKIVNEASLPADRIPNSFTVHYFCRYVPNPTELPEQGEGGNPYAVADGRVVVPRNGSVQIGPFPVGTQCGYEEENPATHPIGIAGFNLATSWNSDICLKPGQGQECGSNYTWLPSEGNHNVEVVNTYTRATGNIEIAKAVVGDAANLVKQNSFDFDVVCIDGGQEIFKKSPLTVPAGGSLLVPNVPVGVDCTVSERQPVLNNVNVTTPAPQTIKVERASQTVRVGMENTIDYKTGPVFLTAATDADGVIDPLEAAGLILERFDVKAECVVPGQAEKETWSGTVVDGSNGLVGTFPLGTTCTFAQTYTPPAGVDHQGTFTPASVTVDSEAGATAHLNNEFWTATGDVLVTKSVSVENIGQVADLDSFIPDTFAVDYLCYGGPSGTLTLMDGDTETITGVPVGAECVFTERNADVEELDRTTTWSALSETSAGDSFTVELPLGGGASVALHNAYAPKMVEVSVEKLVNLVDSEGQPVEQALADAVLGTDRVYSVNFECVRNGEIVGEGTLSMKKGESTTLQMPVGADCNYTPVAQVIPFTLGPDIVVDAQGDHTTVTSTYVLQTGGFNLKKKVDGEGVATISRDRMYDIGYACTFGDLEVARGTESIGRFDSAEDAQVNGIPVGADCVITEPKATAEEANATWESRWTLAAGTTGWETEQPCSSIGDCEVGEGEDSSIKFTIQPVSDAAAGGHFQGTFVVWNTYTYDKVQLKLSNELLGSDRAIAENDTFTYNLVCELPGFRDSDLAGQSYIPDPTIRQQLSVTGANSVVAPQLVPVGYDCIVTADPINTYDAVVERSATEDGQKLTTLAQYIYKEGVDNPQPINEWVSYERPRADVNVTYEFGEHDLSVAQFMTRNMVSVAWECVDNYAQTTYNGVVDVAAGSSVPVLLDGKRLPASVECTFTENVDGIIPAGHEDAVQSSVSVNQQLGTQDPSRIIADTAISKVSLDKDSSTSINFVNTFWMNRFAMSVQKIVEGNPDFTVLPEGTTFQFNYVCEMPHLLPGMDAPFELAGTFELVDAKTHGFPNAPVGTTCEVVEQENSEIAETLDAQGLRMEPNFSYGVADDTEIDETRVVDTNTISLNREKAYAIQYNSIYRNDGEIVVQKVSPEGVPLNGAQFAIFPAAADGSIGAQPVVPVMDGFIDGDASQFSARLTPGDYFLVETRAAEGTQLMPQPWRFKVEVVEGQDRLGDLQVRLANYAEHSGLLEVKEHEADKPWFITVANVEAGAMPLTGGMGIWKILGVGAALLLISVIWFFRTKRND